MCVCLCLNHQAMPLTSDDDGAPPPPPQPRHFPDETISGGVWQMYEDLPPTRQLLADSGGGDYLDFFSAVNTSALALLMTSFGANDSRTLTSAGADTFKTVVDTMTLYVTPVSSRRSSARRGRAGRSRRSASFVK